MSCNTNQQTSTIQNQIPSRGYLAGPQYLPGPELDSLRGALAVRHHDVLEEDGLVAVSPGDAGVVTGRERRLGVLEVVKGGEGSSQVMAVVTRLLTWGQLWPSVAAHCKHCIARLSSSLARRRRRR